MNNEFDRTMKVSKCMFDVEDGLKIANRTCWVYECHRYGRNFVWEMNENSNIWQRIA